MDVVKYVYVLQDIPETDEILIEYQLSGIEIIDYILSQDFGLVSKFYRQYHVDQYVLDGRYRDISKSKNSFRFQELSSILYNKIHIPYDTELWTYDLEQVGDLISIIFYKEKVKCLT